MKRPAVSTSALLLLLAVACGGSVRKECAIAQEKLEQCNTELAAILPPGGLPLKIDDQCSDWNACVAKCVNDASCYGMTWVFLGSMTDPSRMPPLDTGVIM